MKPAHLIPGSLAFLVGALASPAWGQAPPPPADTEPAAVAPAPPPSPAPAVSAPPPADLPPPPPPRTSPAPAPEGKMVISAPPLQPARARRGYHVHDGFYLRMAVGVGGGHASISTDRASSSSYELGAGGLALNLWVGGTPWSGVAIGGLFSLQGISESEAVVEGRTTDEDMDAAYGLLGVFIDAFPDPQRGLHVGGSLGLAGLNARASGDRLENDLGVKDYDGGGLGASAWLGYMGFVGADWSLGGMLQFTGVVTGKEEDELERRGTAWGLNVSFSALYH